MIDLQNIGSQIEAILEREVSRIYNNPEQLDDKSSRALETLSKILDSCQARRDKIPPVDPFQDTSTEELSEEFK